MLVTRSERQCDFLRLNLCDLLRLQLLRRALFMVGQRFVLVDLNESSRVFHFVCRTLPVFQGLEVVTAIRLGLAHAQEGLETHKPDYYF